MMEQERLTIIEAESANLIADETRAQETQTAWKTASQALLDARQKAKDAAEFVTQCEVQVDAAEAQMRTAGIKAAQTRINLTSLKTAPQMDERQREQMLANPGRIRAWT